MKSLRSAQRNVRTYFQTGLLILLSLAPPHALANTGIAVSTTNGVIVGKQVGSVNQFLGIPYAQQPVGERRWRKPLPPLPWSGQLQAHQFGPACPQDNDNFSRSKVGKQSEACLFLNIWVPANSDRPLPVMVWLHGGAHKIGAGSLPFYDGTELAKRGVVLITLNYRLGYLGYFSHPALQNEDESGNFGLQDEIQALSWIQQHIGAFGGDPSKITLFGESAGAVDVMYLMASPAAKSLFHRAIIQSGGGWGKPSTREKLQTSIVDNLGEEQVPPQIDKATLRQLSTETLLKAQSRGKKLGFGPFLDNDIVPSSPSDVFSDGLQLAIPIIVGSNSWEGNLTRVSPPGFLARSLIHIPPFRGLYQNRGENSERRVEMLFGDVVFGAPAQWLARQHARVAPAYLYYFDYVREALRNKLPGAGHGAEIPYAFDTLSHLKDSRGKVSEADSRLASTMADCWAEFAKTGKPDCDFSQWQPHTTERPSVMAITPSPEQVDIHPLAESFEHVEKWFGPGSWLDR